MLIENLLGAIGNTPLVKINKTNSGYANIYGKLESMNPLSSAKDRAALYMIEQAEKREELVPGSMIVEPTSGNTGVGLAYISAIKGYKCILTMPESMSIERRKLLKALGAKVVLTPANLGMQGAIDEAKRINELNPNSFMPQQFNNSDNPLSHYETTAREIYKDLNGKIDIFVSAVGTGGTISGCARYFKEQNDNIQIIGVEPSTSAVLSGEKSGKHGIQGIGAGFIPKNFDSTLVDRIMKVDTEKAYEVSRNIAKTEGLLVGISSGAALAVALKLSREIENKGKNIVVIFPDCGERYLSTTLFDD